MTVRNYPDSLWVYCIMYIDETYNELLYDSKFLYVTSPFGWGTNLKFTLWVKIVLPIGYSHGISMYCNHLIHFLDKYWLIYLCALLPFTDFATFVRLFIIDLLFFCLMFFGYSLTVLNWRIVRFKINLLWMRVCARDGSGILCLWS